jgi:Mrp family chromosome partitioning ATPase
MSTLDQAFIKAYSHDAAAPIVGSAVLDAPSDAPSDTLLPGDRPLDEALIDQGTTVVPPPHADFAAKMAAIEPTRPAFRPLLQVDRFAWPEVCASLQAAASAELQAVADEAAADVAGEGKLLAVTSLRRTEGRTTLILCLARLLSARGLEVALVDADCTRPQLARRLGVLPQVGWAEVLAGAIPLEEAVIQSVGDRMVLLPLRHPAGDDEDLLVNGRLGLTLDSLRRYYSIVLIDAGPLKEAPVARFLGELGRGRRGRAMIVHDIRLTSETERADAAGLLEAAGAVVAGFVENRV